jgi:archaellin
MNENKGISNIALAIVAIAIIVVAVVAYVALTTNSFAPAKPKEVALSGTVTTTGTGTSPEKITFKSNKKGSTYVANANGGSYSISLPNEDTYKVTITWKVLGITGGDADAGTLNLDTTETSMVKNWAG